MKILVKAAKKPGIGPNECTFSCNVYRCGYSGPITA